MLTTPRYDDQPQCFKPLELSDLQKLTNGAIYPSPRLNSILLLLTYLEDKSLLLDNITGYAGVNQTYYYVDYVLDKPVIAGVYDLSCIGEDAIIFIGSSDGFNTINYHYQFDKSDNSLIPLSLDYRKDADDFDYVIKLLNEQVLFTSRYKGQCHEH